MKHLVDAFAGPRLVIHLLGFSVHFSQRVRHWGPMEIWDAVGQLRFLVLRAQASRKGGGGGGGLDARRVASSSLASVYHIVNPSLWIVIGGRPPITIYERR